MTHLLLETSGRGGLVGLARGDVVVQSARLDEARRHVRDLAETVRHLCAAEQIKPQSIAGVVVSIGPGSYTGLRVGLASAKAFAYAVGCPLTAVPTFHAIVEDVPKLDYEVDVVADALKGQAFVQRFRGVTGEWVPVHEPIIVDVQTHMFAAVKTHGPPTLAGLWKASRRLKPLTKDEMFAIEPLYLRGSSAEEKRKSQSVASASSAS